MSFDTIAQHFRGVKCRRCGKPVRLPALVARRESAAHDYHEADDLEFHLVSQVFVLRCHSCRKESIYAINQIVDCAFVPSSDVALAKVATV
jgi:hypothetical protein